MWSSPVIFFQQSTEYKEKISLDCARTARIVHELVKKICLVISLDHWSGSINIIKKLKNKVNRFWWNTFHRIRQCLWVTKKYIWAKNKKTIFWGLTSYNKHVSWLTAIQQHDNESIDKGDCCTLFKDPRHMALGRLQVSLWSDTHFKQVK